MRNSIIIVIFSLVAGIFASQAQTRQTKEEYIARYKHIAIDHMERYGIPASITLAQGILESDSGNSNLVWWSYPIAEVVSLAISLFFYFRLHRTLLSKLPENGETDEVI